MVDHFHEDLGRLTKMVSLGSRRWRLHSQLMGTLGILAYRTWYLLKDIVTTSSSNSKHRIADSPNLSYGDMVQDPYWVPETTDIS